MRLSVPLGQYVQEKGLGEVYAAETGFKLRSNPDTVRAPDLSFITQKRVDKVAEGIPGFKYPIAKLFALKSKERE